MFATTLLFVFLILKVFFICNYMPNISIYCIYFLFHSLNRALQKNICTWNLKSSNFVFSNLLNVPATSRFWKCTGNLPILKVYRQPPDFYGAPKRSKCAPNPKSHELAFFCARAWGITVYTFFPSKNMAFLEPFLKITSRNLKEITSLLVLLPPFILHKIWRS